MDIRDINEKVVYPENGGLSDMYRLQKELLASYIGIEGLPQYPINVNLKSSQTIIKDFVGRVIEELGEGYESYDELMQMFNQGSSRQRMMPYLQNFNEECADALHFWLELLIYSGINEEDIRAYFEIDENDPSQKDTLACMLQAGARLASLTLNGKTYVPGYKVINGPIEDEFMRGGNLLGSERDANICHLLWKATYKFQIARNCLKNKPWKQTQMVTDEKMYKLRLLEGTAYMFAFFHFVGMTPTSIHHIYYKKNMVNRFRIKSKY